MGWHLEKYLGCVRVIHWGCQKVIQMDGPMEIHWGCQKVNQTEKNSDSLMAMCWDSQMENLKVNHLGIQTDWHLEKCLAALMAIHLGCQKVNQMEKYLD